MKTEGKNIYDYNDLSEILTEGIFSTMVKPVGQRCNLNCTYCYYRKPERKESGLMSETLLEEYIRQYITGQDSDIISFCWHGGEPTTAGLAYFKKAVELQKKYSDGKQIDNTLQTRPAQHYSGNCPTAPESMSLRSVAMHSSGELRPGAAKRLRISLTV